jgi:hypothetical protein
MIFSFLERLYAGTFSLFLHILGKKALKFLVTTRSVPKVFCQESGDVLKRLIGFSLFWIAIGMSLMFFIENAFIAILLILICLLLGYVLFCGS